MTFIFRTIFDLSPGKRVLIQARYCPDQEHITSVAVHPVLGKIVGPSFMDEADLDLSTLKRLHRMIFKHHAQEDNR